MDKLRILLVTTDEQNAELTNRLSDDFIILRVSDVAEACEILREDAINYSACIIDTPCFAIPMQKIVADARNAQGSEFFPVFLIVPDGDLAAAEEAYAAHPSDILTRPYRPYAHMRIANVVRENGQLRKIDDELKRLQDLQVENQRFMERIPGGLFRYRRAEPGCDTIDYISPGLLSIMGCSSAYEFRALTNNTFHGMVYPDDIARVEATIEEQVQHDGTDRVQYRIKRADGEIRWLEDWGRLVRDENGDEWFYVVALDITESIEYQEELKRIGERMAILSVFNDDITFDVNYRRRTAEVFGDFRKRFGRPFDFSDYNRVAEQEQTLIIDEDALTFILHDDAHYEGDASEFDIIVPNADGEPIWTRCQIAILRDDRGRPYRCVGRLLDTHDMMMRQISYQSEAEHDGLTDLYNRKAAIRLIESFRSTSDAPCSFMLMDVDNFKNINDTYGHPVGDEVLVHLAKFIGRYGRGNDVVARLGGDEFCIFISGLGPGERLSELVAEINSEAFKDFKSEEADIPADELSLSIGVVSTKDNSISLEDLYEGADRALYKVKRAGRNGAEFNVV